jgi:hypothetical protein
LPASRSLSILRLAGKASIRRRPVTSTLGLAESTSAGRRGKANGACITYEELLVLPNVVFREVDEQTLEAVLAVTLAPEQEPYVGSVSEALEEARELPEGKPWYRAVFDGELAVGFVMLSWNVPPNPPEIIGPWYLWKLIVDCLCVRRQRNARMHLPRNGLAILVLVSSSVLATRPSLRPNALIGRSTLMRQRQRHDHRD